MYTIWVRGEVYIHEIITTMCAINMFYGVKYAIKCFLPSFLVTFSFSDYFESWHCLTLRSTFFKSVNMILIFYYFSVDSYGSDSILFLFQSTVSLRRKFHFFHDLVSVLKLQGIFNNIKANTENQILLWKYLFITNLFHSDPKERQCQRMLKLPHNCTHLTC